MATAKNDKEWSNAVRKAVHEYREAKDETGKVKKIRYLNLLAAKLVESAAAGDMTAMKEVGDRLDGKPQQAVEHSGDIEHRYVARMPEADETADEWQARHSPTIQ